MTEVDDLVKGIQTELDIQHEEELESELIHIREDLEDGEISVYEAEDMVEELIDYHVSARIKIGQKDWEEMDITGDMDVRLNAEKILDEDDER